VNHRIRAMLLILWVPGMALVTVPAQASSLGVSGHSWSAQRISPILASSVSGESAHLHARARSGTPIQRHAERRSSTSPYRPIIPALLLNTAMTKPTVTALSPASGPLAGGTQVTVSGSGFTGTTAVKFGSKNATSFTVVSASEITAVAPAASAGTVSVTVTSAGSTTVTTSADEFTYSAQPFVTSISPASGPVSGKTKVTVTGAQLTAATKVSFGGTPGTGVSVSSARALSVMSPARAAGTVNVTVTTPQGASPISPSAGFTYVPPPTVTKVTPASGPVTGQTSVTVTGTSLGGASAVYFGAVRAASVAAVSATRLTAVAPAEKAGTVNVTVTTPGGTSAASSADRFLFTGPAPVSRLTATAEST
jgi:hypothetical protein